ncbi:Ferrichrome ABC transporter ATP-binding protein [Erythrobacter sp. NAP1]|uniref:ABC transporter ATP-binding protein n=1 Tax=Erythrobacter sp. NAP1 TaxID=237727 RepID=UPI0000686DDD|nr:ABC transporter ATP-binding protein [Erythrobacter sp. NAP1]EAQ30542.1 Ferrichrome ABC transporter ATP-binding protein [Erythrobacter sp. NAP1]
MLEANNLSIERGGRRVLSDVSAAFAAGEITAIVGPNGAGKSSLVLALAGLLDPVGGAVTLDGRSIHALPPRERARMLGYLPQDTDIAWDVAVEQLVALGRLPHGDRGRDEVEAAISMLALEDLRHRPASRLSGGEKARVLLARVLAGTPEWVLADEPLAALDLAHAKALTEHFREIADSGSGVVLVVHDLAVAMNCADRVIVLSDGKCVATGTPADALTQEIIKRVWGVDADWLGKPGQHALVIRRP